MCIAGIVALKHFRKPEIEVVGEDVTVVGFIYLLVFLISNPDKIRVQHSPLERAPIPLSIHHTPFCFTFAFFPPTPQDSQTTIILDPTKLEQTLSSGLLSIALNAQREICVLQKHGGVPLDQDEILKVVKVACQRVKERDVLVEDALAKDWQQRKATVEVI